MMRYLLVGLAMLFAAADARAAGTQAVSREVVYYIPPSPATLAVSREAVYYVPPRPPTAAVSRTTTYFVNYRLSDVGKALRIAAGLEAATNSDRQVLDVVGGASASVVDVLDATALGRYVTHPELLP